MLPAIALLFGQYLAMALSADSTAQRPERLFQERGLMMLVVLVVGLFAVCTLVKIPALAPLTMQYFIKLPSGSDDDGDIWLLRCKALHGVRKATFPAAL